VKIYTYYDDISMPYQLELLKLWSESWSRNGFEPCVITSVQTKSYSDYNEFYSQIKNIILAMMPNRKTEKRVAYSLACFIRWFAYSREQHDDYCFFSDYDVININLSIKDILIKKSKYSHINFLDHICPCFAIGKPEFCKDLCEDMIRISWHNILKNNIAEKVYHDQTFFINNLDLLKNRYKFTKHSKLFAKTIHFSHNYIERLHENILKTNMNKNYYQNLINKLRIKTIKEVLCKAVQ